ncbi:biopolymer transporter ExbD [Longimonas halophila]|uniref:Biopolymer transporter ExbD n=1 Tax=Longimonas halophila TaxID=1469170 RepID=A0A2H3P7F0_9BACT|nr:biopolymer transporter ExbD [Longimonas halophila]PEN07061.1 biopolymer transporter ExbD [Longimonas halophila]
MSFDFEPSRAPVSSISLAGMTDVVLLLLVFFLLTSSFVPQLGIEVTLPQVDASAPVEQQYITVSVTEDGSYFVDGTPASEGQLTQQIRDARRTETTTVVLRADEGATIRQFATVASAAQALNLRVLMATERR